jgi:hypothetical protein
MPAGMPGYVGKGPIFGALDLVLNDPVKRAQMLTRITKRNAGNTDWDEKFIDILASMLGLSGPQKDHIDEHWFGSNYDEAWWPRALPVDIICRLGLTQAIKLASPPNPALKMDTYWVCGVNDVQLVSIIGPGALTLLMFTPFAPASDQMPGQYTANKEQIYTTRHKSMGPGEFQFAPDQYWVEFAQALAPKP